MASMEAWLLASGFLEELSTESAVTELSEMKQITKINYTSLNNIHSFFFVCKPRVRRPQRTLTH